MVAGCRIVRCDFGAACLAAGAARARPALRRTVLHRRGDDRHLLPADLSGAEPARAERAVLRDSRWRSRCRVPALPSLPSRGCAGNAGLAGHIGYGIARSPADRRARPRRSPSRSLGLEPRHRIEASAPSVRRAHRRIATRCASHAPTASCETTARRNLSAVCDDCFRGGLRQCQAVQRGDQEDLAAHADSHSPALRLCQTAGLLSAPLVPAAIRLGRHASVPGRARHRRDRVGRRQQLRALVRSGRNRRDVRGPPRCRASRFRRVRVVGGCASALSRARPGHARARSGRGSRCHRGRPRSRFAPIRQRQAAARVASAWRLGRLRNCRPRHRRTAGLSGWRPDAPGSNG